MVRSFSESPNPIIPFTEIPFNKPLHNGTIHGSNPISTWAVNDQTLDRPRSLLNANANQQSDKSGDSEPSVIKGDCQTSPFGQRHGEARALMRDCNGSQSRCTNFITSVTPQYQFNCKSCNSDTNASLLAQKSVNSKQCVIKCDCQSLRYLKHEKYIGQSPKSHSNHVEIRASIPKQSVLSGLTYRMISPGPRSLVSPCSLSTVSTNASSCFVNPTGVSAQATGQPKHAIPESYRLLPPGNALDQMISSSHSTLRGKQSLNYCLGHLCRRVCVFLRQTWDHMKLLRNSTLFTKGAIYLLKKKIRDWEITAKKVDNFSMIMFPLSFVIFNACYWGIYFMLR